MSKNIILRVVLTISCLFILFIFGLTACQTESESTLTVVETQASQSEQPTQSDSTSIPATQAPSAVETEIEDPEPDLGAIEAAWQSSSHADSFVLDANGQNNTCARCHAPINWMPSMEDLPESCYTCKFELEDPPSTISEGEWTDIPCNICHEVDKKGNVQAEYAWLEIAPLGEYAQVASPTELCLKCHTAADVPGHNTVQLGGDHPGYVCTDCHSAHDTTTSCNAVGCHPDVIEPATPIPGHDQDHQSVTCGACHDASGMEVGPDEESGLWTTFISASTDTGAERFSFTSHNVVLEASCDRCHFVSNPWGLSENVLQP